MRSPRHENDGTSPGDAQAPRPQFIRPVDLSARRVEMTLEDALKDARAGDIHRCLVITEDHENHLRIRVGGMVLNLNELAGFIARALSKATV